MVSRVAWRGVYRIVPSRYPAVGIFDDVADPSDLPIVVALAAATNPRVLEEAGNLDLVRPKDRIAGPGATPVMAAFTHAGPSRFGDGSYGIYYAARAERTAIAETAYHRARFLRDARLPDERLDMRAYTANVTGRYDDVRKLSARHSIYNPNDYTAGNARGLKTYEADALDGIAFNSVRDPGDARNPGAARNPAGQCIAVFRPTRITHCTATHHLEYRFQNYTLQSVMTIAAIS